MSLDISLDPDKIIADFMQQNQISTGPAPPYSASPGCLSVPCLRRPGKMPRSAPREDLPQYKPDKTPAVAPDQKVMDAVSNAVTSPAGKAALRKAIDDLGDSAFSIDVCFTNVARGLDRALPEASTQDQRAKIIQFQDEWDKHRKRYIDLLWSSRVVAGHARTTARDFAKDFLKVLKDENISLDDKKEEIRGYLEQISEDVKKSQNLAQGFTDLQTSIFDFQENVSVWLETSKEMQRKINQLLGKINETNEAIKMLTKQMFMGAASSLALGGVAAGALAIGILCPFLWIGAAVAAVHAVGKGKGVLDQMKARKDQLADLEKQKAELERLQGALVGMQKIHTILGPLQSDMALIREKLGVFSSIWHFISADLVEINKSMQMATTARTKHLFNLRLDTIEEIYSALCDALYQYETRVHTQPAFAAYK